MSTNNRNRRRKKKTTPQSNGTAAASQKNNNAGNERKKAPARPAKNKKNTAALNPQASSYKPAPTALTSNKPPPKKNGEKGAEVHTVLEKERIDFTRLLMELRESPNEHDSLEFPSTLTNTERKFLHQLASRLGLKSKSTGKDPNRRIVVTKKPDVVVNKSGGDLDSIPSLKVGRKGVEALKRHFAKHPRTPNEEMESRETGSSLAQALNETTGNAAAVEQSLAQMGLTHEEVEQKVVAPRKVDLKRRQRQHAAFQQQKRAHSEYKKFQRIRSQLPAYAHEEEILSVVSENSVTIISGDTGSGKSTQIPQFLLDALPEANIVVTQPRRISAISLAERVAQEQCSSGNKMVGHQVRLESSFSPYETQLLFVTPGILLKKLQSSPTLQEFTHVILDEVHERDKYTEFLMILLRDMLVKRPSLKIILMSATLQIPSLQEYWSGAAHLHIQGRMYPVQEFHLEQVLSMTGYIEAVGGDVVTEDLDAVLQQQQSSTGLTCIMCGQGGFADGLELGAHVALCDGGGGETMDALESRVRQMDVSTTGDCVRQEEEEDESQKWDGVSPFEAATTTTAAEEQLLTQYQSMQDDEQVDYALLLEVIRFIVKSADEHGAILVFFASWQEISEFSYWLETTPQFCDPQKFLVLPLHSGIPSRDQRRVLQPPPRGVRKIILSTNIAETSLTIDGVAFVVDTGRAKEKSYDPHLKTSTLQPTWISQASAKQRKGRAGRTKAGVCFRLFSQRRYESMRPFCESELLRTPLEEMCLMCKKLGLTPGGPQDADGVPAFLSKAMSAPHTKSVANALELLVELGAMEPETNNLTNLGQCLSVLSVEPRVGKMVIWSYILGCARVTSSMAVAMSYKSPFILPPQSMRRAADNAKVQLSQNSESDQVTVLYALRKRDQLTKNNRSGSFNDFCRRHFLGTSTMQMISDLRRSLTRELTSLGFPQPTAIKQYHNRHDDDQALWQAAIAAGLYPNVASRRQGEVNFSTMTNRKAKIHVSSVNAVRGQPLNAKCQVPVGDVEFVAFGEMVKGTTFFTMNQTTHLASPLPLLLLCGSSLTVRPFPDDPKTAILEVDDWIVFKCSADIASHIVILRKRLEASFWHYVSNPSAGLSSLTPAERDAVEILGTVHQSAHRSAPGR